VSSIAIGDIHGNLEALNDLLAQIEPTVMKGDTVIFLGDYIDRGPDSRGCIERILRLRAESSATIVTLCGNHEDWLLETMRDHTRHSWLLAMEVFPTIESYSPEAAQALKQAMRDLGPRALREESAELPYDLFFDAMPESHVEFLTGLELYHQNQDGVFVHAGLDVDVADLEQQSRFALLMGTAEFIERYAGPPVVVYGHRNNAVMRDGWPHPRVTQWTIGIDSSKHGVLTAVRLPDGSVAQSARYRHKK
jgi:serine/threonine protein phosphatase 1